MFMNEEDEKKKIEGLRTELSRNLDDLTDKIQYPGNFKRWLARRLKKKKKIEDEYPFNSVLEPAIELSIGIDKMEFPDLQKLRKKIIVLESEYKKKVFYPNLYSALAYSILGICLVLFLILYDHDTYYEIGDNKYYIVGVAGTILYYTIKTIQSQKRMDRVKKFLARLTTTLIICFVLITFLDKESLVFSEHGETMMIYFACGYSIEFVIQLLNKIIEKVSAIIKGI